MAIVAWTGAGYNASQVDTLTVSAVAAGGTITATMGIAPFLVSITYTMTGTDTTSTAAAAILALLSASTAPPQFADAQWTVSSNVITATASTPGTPFTLSASSAGGATMTHAITTPNSSQSDVSNPANWLRLGVQALPQNGDDVVLQDSTVPLLWNLSAFAGVSPNSFSRWQSFIGTVGLPLQNPNGYFEYRVTDLQFYPQPGGASSSSGSPSTPLAWTLGVGQVGSGPTRERYNVGSQQVNLTVIAAGSPSDAYSVHFLGANPSNTLTVGGGVSVGVAMTVGQTAALASATVANGGSLSLGAGVTFSGQLTVDSAAAIVTCAVPTTLAQSSSSVTVQSTGLTYNSVTAKGSSRVTWLSNSNIGTLNLQTGSAFDKSKDTRPITITNSAFDGDTTQILDPWGAVTYTNPTAVANAVNSGPFVYPPGKSVKIV
jgi:hypothetical protein